MKGFPQGTDLSLLNKLHNHHSKNRHYLQPLSDETHTFGITHFAGNVYYYVRLHHTCTYHCLMCCCASTERLMDS